MVSAKTSSSVIILVFTFTAECWVRVEDPAGGDLYSDLNRAGSTLELTGGGPDYVFDSVGAAVT